MCAWFFGRSKQGGEIAVVSACPECGSQWLAVREGRPACPNPDCPAQVRRGLVHWCAPEVMDIPSGDEAMVALLVQHGLVRDVAELYRLKVKELAALPGLTPESAQQFFDAITASMKRDAWRLLFGLGIPLVGATEAQALTEGFPTVGAVFAAGVPRMIKDAGVSREVAESLVRWHSDSVNRKLVRRLEKFGVNFQSEQFNRAKLAGL